MDTPLPRARSNCTSIRTKRDVNRRWLRAGGSRTRPGRCDDGDQLGLRVVRAHRRIRYFEDGDELRVTLVRVADRLIVGVDRRHLYGLADRLMLAGDDAARVSVLPCFDLEGRGRGQGQSQQRWSCWWDRRPRRSRP